MKNSNFLKKCPHCNSPAWMYRNNNIFFGEINPKYNNQIHGFRVECEGVCHSMTCWWHTEEEARDMWNMRVENTNLEKMTGFWASLTDEQKKLWLNSKDPQL